MPQNKYKYSGTCTYWASDKEKLSNMGIVDCIELNSRILVKAEDLIRVGYLIKGEEVLISDIKTLENGTIVGLGVRPKLIHEYYEACDTLEKLLDDEVQDLYTIHKASAKLARVIKKMHEPRKKYFTRIGLYRRLMGKVWELRSQREDYVKLPELRVRQPELIDRLLNAAGFLPNSKITGKTLRSIFKKLSKEYKPENENSQFLDLIYELFYLVRDEYEICDINQIEGWHNLYIEIKEWIVSVDEFTLIG